MLPPTESQLEFGAVRVYCGYSTCRPTGKHHRSLVHASVAYRHGYTAGPSLQSLAPPLVPTFVLGSTLSTPVVPTCVSSTPLTDVAAAMPSTSLGADTRPTYVSLGVPLTTVSPLVSTKAVPSVVTTATAPPPPLPLCLRIQGLEAQYRLPVR